MSGIIGKCTKCHRKVDVGGKYLSCDLCKNSCHCECENLTSKTVDSILAVKQHVVWLCTVCKSKDPLNILSIIPKIVEMQAELSKEVASIRAEVSSMPKEKSEKTQTQSYEGAIAEMALRKSKENNLVVFGMKTTNEKVKEVETMFIKELEVDVTEHIQRVTKGGKDSKLIFIKFKDQETRNAVLRAAKKLKSSASPHVRKIWINPDYTPSQLSYLKALRSEAKILREKGERAFVRGLKLIKATDSAHVPASQNTS